MTLSVGDKAPNFNSKLEDGTPFKMEDVVGESNIVLYFYPKDNSYGCTREACKFRDEFDEFKNLNATIIGVNRGTADSHKKFIEDRKLPFHILVDEDSSIYKLYNVKSGIIGERVTYVIDREGTIRHVFNSQAKYNQHPEEARKALEIIEGKSGPKPTS